MARAWRQMADDESDGPLPGPTPFEKRLDAAIRRPELQPRQVIADLDLLDDIMQEAAIRTHAKYVAKPHKFDKPGSLEGYLAVVARRIAVKHLEGSANAEERAREYHAALEDAIRQKMDPSALVEALDTYKSAGEGLNAKTAHLRRAFLLYKGEEISLAEAAEMCGVTIPAFKTYVAVILKHMRGHMNERRPDRSGRSSSEVPARPTWVRPADDMGLNIKPEEQR
jgi:DNA-directed RNA polymerase specialized sigma24 family protein